jgi:uncharacterized protein YgiM (DUF1202 family)
MKRTLAILFCMVLVIAPNAWGNGDSYEALLNDGEKYHVFQYRANIRAKPSRDGKVLAVLNFGDQVEILENTDINEEINDVWGYWYKVKYGRITGYTFGGNLAVEMVIADIDKNGVNDYVCYRFSEQWNSRVYVPTDIKIIINNKAVSIQELTVRHEGRILGCELIARNNYFIIILKEMYRIGSYVYKLYPEGDIQFIERVPDDEYYDPINY